MLMDCRSQYYNTEEYVHEHGKGKAFINSIYDFHNTLNIKLMLGDI